MDQQSATNLLMHFGDGYSLRNTIGIWKTETDRITMIVSPRTVKISFINDVKCCMHEVVLNASEFVSYHYDITDADGELLPEYPIVMNTLELSNAVKQVQRRDGLRLYWLINSKTINIQPIKANNKGPGQAGALFVNILQEEPSSCETPTGYAEEPNVRIPAKEFGELCAHAATTKCGFVEIQGSTNSALVRGMQTNNTPAFVNKFVAQTPVARLMKPMLASNIDDVYNLLSDIKIPDVTPATYLSLNVKSQTELMTVRVPIATAKALSKIHNISTPGTQLKFFFLSGSPAKIVSTIGSYGLYSIYLRNPR